MTQVISTTTECTTYTIFPTLYTYFHNKITVKFRTYQQIQYVTGPAKMDEVGTKHTLSQNLK